MGIKWADVHIGTSPLTGNIYIGKTKKDSNLTVWTDKSKDKTNECVMAVMEHMLIKAEEENKSKFRYEIPGVVRLTLENLKKGGEQSNEVQKEASSS